MKAVLFISSFEKMKPIIKLVIKLFFVLLPLWLLLIFYASSDPFKVLYNYEIYDEDLKPFVPLNRDFVSTQNFLNRNEKENYDSFIFGSSRSLAFRCSDWNKFVNAHPYHFDANGESLFGILTKLEYLEKKKIPVKNCLIVLDSSILAVTENVDNHLYIKHPAIANESKINFHFVFLKAFLSNKFFIPYIALKFNSEFTKNLSYQGIVDHRVLSYEEVTNDVIFSGDENEISTDPDSYYQKRKETFYKRDTLAQKYYSKVIFEKQLILLQRIKNALSFLHSNYKIIIYPLYDQKKLDDSDEKILRDIFGSENVFDFSGVNKLTNNIENYYEADHCRAKAGLEMLKTIYTNK